MKFYFAKKEKKKSLNFFDISYIGNYVNILLANKHSMKHMAVIFPEFIHSY